MQPSSPIMITAGTLQGSGTAGTITAVGNGGLDSIIIAPGTSPGLLTCSNLTLNPSTTFAVELNGATPGSGYDRVNVNGSISLGGSTLSVQLGFVPNLGNSFTIINNDGTDAISGTFSGLAEGATFKGGSGLFRISYAAATAMTWYSRSSATKPESPKPGAGLERMHFG